MNPLLNRQAGRAVVLVACLLITASANAQSGQPEGSTEQASKAAPTGQPQAPEAPLRPAPKAPAPEMERPTDWGEATEVKVGIYIIDVDEVDSADQNYAASVYYEAR